MARVGSGDLLALFPMNHDEDKQPSEVRYGISKQPPPTCPIINDALESVNKLQKRIRNYERADEDELRDMLSDVETHLGYLSGYGNSGLLEDIRGRTEEIRAWGQEWKDYAKDNAPAPEAECLG